MEIARPYSYSLSHQVRVMTDESNVIPAIIVIIHHRLGATLRSV